MISNRRTKSKEESTGEHEHSEDLAAALAALGCILAYIAWHLHAHQLPFVLPVSLHLPRPGVGMLLAALVGGTLLLSVLALWIRRRWRRRLAGRVTRALIEAGLEGRNPRNPEKPIRPRLRAMRREGKDVWVIGFRMPVKGSAITVDQIRPHLEQHLDSSIQTWADNGLVWLRLGTRRMPTLVPFGEPVRGPAGNDLLVAIGVSREGELLVDLTDLPHLLVGGTTGAGKSVFLRVLLTRLALACLPEHLSLVLADLKGGMEFTLFRRLPHLFCPVISDREGFLDSMDQVCAELGRRMKLYGDREVESLKRWNDEHPDERMPYLVVVVDELAEVTSKGTGDREEQVQRRRAVHAISQIARLGRAVGIHMVLCTQRPDAEIVEGQAKSNMGATLAFRTRDATQSQILLGPGDMTASQIPAGIPGRGIWKWVDAGIQVQTPLLEMERARELLAGVRRSGDRPEPTSASRVVQRTESGDEGESTCSTEDPSNPTNSSAAASLSFDVTRLAIGRQYEFRLSGGRSVVGVLRALELPTSDRDEEAQPMLVTCDGQDRVLDRREIVAATRSRGER